MFSTIACGFVIILLTLVSVHYLWRSKNRSEAEEANPKLKNEKEKEEKENTKGQIEGRESTIVCSSFSLIFKPKAEKIDESLKLENKIKESENGNRKLVKVQKSAEIQLKAKKEKSKKENSKKENRASEKEIKKENSELKNRISKLKKENEELSKKLNAYNALKKYFIMHEELDKTTSKQFANKIKSTKQGDRFATHLYQVRTDILNYSELNALVNTTANFLP